MALQTDVRTDRRWGITISLLFLEKSAGIKSPDKSNEAAQSDKRLCNLSIYFKISKDSDNGQRRPRSDCAPAQSDLGLRCPHSPERHIFQWQGSYAY